MLQRILFIVARILGAIIMAQTLFFKFSGAEESVWIFSTVGKELGLEFMEPYGRILYRSR